MKRKFAFSIIINFFLNKVSFKSQKEIQKNRKDETQSLIKYPFAF